MNKLVKHPKEFPPHLTLIHSTEKRKKKTTKKKLQSTHTHI